MKSDKKNGTRKRKVLTTIKKYVWRLLFVTALCFGFFLIKRPVESLIRLRAEISDLEKEKARYEEIIRQDSIFIESLEDDEILEKFARERYFMQGKNEHVFIVE